MCQILLPGLIQQFFSPIYGNATAQYIQTRVYADSIKMYEVVEIYLNKVYYSVNLVVLNIAGKLNQP